MNFSGQNDIGTERRDKRAFSRDRMATGQKGGTERLGSVLYTRIMPYEI